MNSADEILVHILREAPLLLDFGEYRSKSVVQKLFISLTQCYRTKLRATVPNTNH